MKIVILSRKKRSYFNDRVKELCNSGIEVEVVDPYDCQLCLENGQSLLLHKGEVYKNADIVIPRIDSIALEYSAGIIKHFEKSEAIIINGLNVLSKCKNKYEMLQFLKDIEGVNVPKSFLIKNHKELGTGIKQFNSLPVLLKFTAQLERSIGPVLIEKSGYADAFLDFNFIFAGIAKVEQSIIIQEYIRDSTSRFINYLIIGNNVVAGYPNQRSLAGHTALNIIKKGISNKIELTDNQRKFLLNIAQKFDLNFGVVSTIEVDKDNFVYEVNPLPDIEELEKNFNFDIVPELVKYIASCK